MSRRAAVLFLFCLAPSALIAQKKPVTIEALTAQRPPQPAQPVWAPDGARFAYLEGRRLWLYEVSSRSRRELVSLDALEAAATKVPPPEVSAWRNRNVREQTLQWTPSGREILISAGGDLFLFRPQAGGWTQLTATPEAERNPKLSPDGRWISFCRGHELYVLEIASQKVTPLTSDSSPTLWNAEADWVYPEELNLETAYWWSPDSTRLAYLQFDLSREPLYPQTDLLPLRPLFEPERYPKAGDPNADVRLGVISVDRPGRTHWLDLGQTRDTLLARVAWLPTSRSLAVQRLNRIQNHLDLLLADAQTGASKVVLEEADPHWVNVTNDLRFLKSGQEFLWSSERSGFRHLYRYSIDGRPLAQLTRGDWEVTEVAGVDEATGQVFYLSTQESPLERHLYRVPLDASAPQRLSQAPGFHSVSMAPGCAYYLASFSNLTTPPRRTLHRSDGTEWAVFQESDRKALETYDLLPAEILQVKAPDGALLYARLVKPAGFQPAKKYPAIVLVYGGPHAQSVRNAWSGLNFEQVLAHRGFLVWQLDNRGSSGRGHRFESAVFRNFGAQELEDQKAGLRHLISMGFVDLARIGIHGWSFGGYMTLYSLLNAPDLFAAGIAGAPVTDWRNYDTIYTERYMGLPSENADNYRRSSPVHSAANLKARLLLIHNFEDDNVLFQNTLQMAAALERAGKQFSMLIYPQKAHGLTGPLRTHLNQTMLSFFEETLKKN
jgi:dipeptidyl-peptidase-4